MTREKRRSSRNRRRTRSAQKGATRWLYLVVPILATVVVSIGVSSLQNRPGSGSPTTPEIQLAPVAQLPERVRRAPLEVQEAYQFAIANPDVLGRLPCYCQCGDIGHKSDLDCFIQRFNPDGTIVFDYHAFGWAICVDIARDAIRLLKQGKSLKDIRTYVDRQYSRFGAPTDTEPVG